MLCGYLLNYVSGGKDEGYLKLQTTALCSLTPPCSTGPEMTSQTAVHFLIPEKDKGLSTLQHLLCSSAPCL